MTGTSLDKTKEIIDINNQEETLGCDVEILELGLNTVYKLGLSRNVDWWQEETSDKLNEFPPHL